MSVFFFPSLIKCRTLPEFLCDSLLFIVHYEGLTSYIVSSVSPDGQRPAPVLWCRRLWQLRPQGVTPISHLAHEGHPNNVWSLPATHHAHRWNPHCPSSIVLLSGCCCWNWWAPPLPPPTPPLLIFFFIFASPAPPFHWCPLSWLGVTNRGGHLKGCVR